MWLRLAGAFAFLLIKKADATLDFKKERKFKKQKLIQEYERVLKKRDYGKLTLIMDRLNRLR